VFHPSHLVSVAALTALIAASNGGLTAVRGQVQGGQAPPTAGTATASPRPGAGAPASQTSGEQGARGQGANAQSQGRGSGSGGRSPAPWWRDEAVKKELNLRPDQFTRLEALFAQHAREIEPLTAEVAKQRAELDRLRSDMTSDSRTVQRAIELQVALMEVPRVKMNERFYLLLYRSDRVLDPEQYKKLQEIRERTPRGRGGN
jgi:hypothetical protein